MNVTNIEELHVTQVNNRLFFKSANLEFNSLSLAMRIFSMNLDSQAIYLMIRMLSKASFVICIRLSQKDLVAFSNLYNLVNTQEEAGPEIRITNNPANAEGP